MNREPQVLLRATVVAIGIASVVVLGVAMATASGVGRAPGMPGGQSAAGKTAGRIPGWENRMADSQIAVRTRMEFAQVRHAEERLRTQGQLAAAHSNLRGLRIKFAHVRRSVAAVPFAGNNMTFTPGTAPGGAVSEQAAINSAEQVHGPVQIDSTFSAEAEYGSFTDSEMGTMGPDGKVVLKYVDRPVWVVTFVSPAPHTTSVVNPAGHALSFSKSQWSFIVDAYSGQTLLGI